MKTKINQTMGDNVQISFGFKKKIQSKVDEKKIVKDPEDDAEENKDYLNNAESLHKKPEKKELIIPLIQRNRWRVKPELGNGQQEMDELQLQAAKEIAEKSKQFLGNRTAIQDNDDDNFENTQVPLLMKNKVPEGFETDERLNVALRAEEASLADYNQIPISAFGMAMIRGMGWNPKVGIGKTFKQNTKVLETTLRPKGLGLGATAPTSKAKPNQEKQEEAALEVKKGAYVLVQTGSHKRKYGVVEGVDTDNAQCLVKFALDGKTASVGEFALKAVAKNEYKEFGKDISRFSKAYNERPKEMEHRNHEEQHPISDNEKKTHKHKKHKRDHDNKSKTIDEEKGSHSKHKHKAEKRQREKERERKPSSKKQKYRTWLCSNLRVRMISEKYKKGKYYREKLVVDDVLDAAGHCTCRTDGGRLLDDISEDMLETVVPRSTSDAHIVIVSKGRLKEDGKLAKVIEKDKEKCEAYVQLVEDRDVVLQVKFDEMCEYAGDAEAHAMF